ncbi:ankyrin repeat protein [Histoplasma capsulatum G186AR]|uniref:Ankyrin repeat protein n=2 Tax=Ajellomyces capsulatus TaxID=5037 RepID=C0NDJ9_AJECG|nr:ankyrin repeat protein [Histoplasma capsulatum G186AR]EEH10297.1 ankyrin repeat protein [Histoplasma capsulatum G186AR]
MYEKMVGAEFDEKCLSQYDSATLVSHIVESCKLSLNVSLLSQNLVAKHYSRGKEVDVLEAMVRAGQLGIRVPCIRRTVERDNDFYIIMERIHGQTLEEAWKHIGWLIALRLAFQLRRFVRRMREVTSSTAGSLSTGMCRSFWLEDFYKLPCHARPEAIPAFIRFWLNFVPLSRRKASVQPKKEFCSKPQTPLVFTHHDLAPRNVVLDDKRRLWLLDWDYSGFYPIYFEYASMHNFSVPENWGWADRLCWEIFSWISVGCFSKQRKALEEIRPRFTRFPLGRKHEVLLDGAPSNAVHLRKPGM